VILPAHDGRTALFFLAPLLWNLSCARDKQDAETPGQVTAGKPRLIEIFSPVLMGGAEICFNGIDDNQNTLIDEGCGVVQSEVQFVLAWDSDADFDLYVSDPQGEVAVVNGTTASGLTLSADCPNREKACRGQNYENVYVEDADIAPGTYHVRVRLEKAPAKSNFVKARLGVRLPNRTAAYEIEMFDEGQEIMARFEVRALAKQLSSPSEQGEQ
jgi:hypothetical protein